MLFCSRFDLSRNDTSSKVSLLIYRDEKITSVVLLCCSVPTKSRKAAMNCQRAGGEVRPRLDRVPIWVGWGTRLDLGRFSVLHSEVGGETDPPCQSTLPPLTHLFGDLTNAKYHISAYIFSSHFSTVSVLQKHKHIFTTCHKEIVVAWCR